MKTRNEVWGYVGRRPPLRKLVGLVQKGNSARCDTVTKLATQHRFVHVSS